MFQKPLNNSLASANNKHCSLHRIYQVDMKRQLAGWYRGCLINVSYSMYRLGKPPKCEGSLVSGDNTEFLLVIMYWQTVLCISSMENTLKFRQIPSLTGEVKDFSQWGGGKQEREARCPTRNPPLSRSKCWSGAKRNFDLNRTTGAGTIIWLPVSHTVLKLVQ